MKDRKSRLFQREFIDLFGELSGCGLQENGSPCNTCFHSSLKGVGVPDETAHNLWKCLLVIRGDYTEDQVWRDKGW